MKVTTNTENDTRDEHQILPAGEVSDTSQEENEAVVTSALGAATEGHINGVFASVSIWTYFTL